MKEPGASTSRSSPAMFHTRLHMWSPLALHELAGRVSLGGDRILPQRRLRRFRRIDQAVPLARVPESVRALMTRSTGCLDGNGYRDDSRKPSAEFQREHIKSTGCRFLVRQTVRLIPF